jgi:hypothetical protein
MTELKDIPDDVKWRIAARCASTLPAMYDLAFRSTMGKEFDGLEQEIWLNLARIMVPGIVRDLSLPIRNAHELAQSIQIVMALLFGPDYSGETLDVSEDGAVMLVKRCPFVNYGCSMGAKRDHLFSKCMALTLTAIPVLNRKYSARYVRTLCTGDRQCEIKVEIIRKPEEGKKQD